jgi:hypothetical protein
MNCTRTVASLHAGVVISAPIPDPVADADVRASFSPAMCCPTPSVSFPYALSLAEAIALNSVEFLGEAVILSPVISRSVHIRTFGNCFERWLRLENILCFDKL